MSQLVLEACQAGIEAWKAAFNRQDAKGCAEKYAEDTTMIAKPFGTFEGREQIQAFWQNIIDQGFSDVSYTDTKWEKVDDNNYILSSKWTMNKAFGVVHKEVWTLQEDGKARLTYDEFEVLGER
ncbi:YybH family protein [Vibrio neptunius]|uniref:Nuclear transport factor 2 family protein n=1 Tax=Vibrio neptunius TaxID=170651 RepID=A0ABS3A629_9VIBR|nr:nuclear transport factor 2 family protein [Vibrio neptunius]MBN3494849.1 nuclear transport factor 2 family protein [Vibrio neptunius]MBN3517215.1 nuclear transport factor 2 family protein [Vibrio neptunius]MBN3551598.1 nuclear transport factor 2 family protein [Vibrio neptunius]MBN3579664.1 nuclear transport factor 2 family protein [Vibrio neptunius]MCH9873329.1 nuclear transport factor 2 family protein [Vibrio neptunius]